jgi:hypothetical protein
VEERGAEGERGGGEGEATFDIADEEVREALSTLGDRIDNMVGTRF